ncbi:oxidoreductase family protein [Gracilinema caldarium DSM 7334]|uniref:Oxidoreductase family protein n=1 Tax=Gracilinema caldarium (strain ATCC 51460 / DSM 7334 / H1) TaxID=744872 RepID=F8F022_GRAC1|nr:oxidoreductase family protein [Gracilinema caldarium DSM 7334]
MLSGLYPDSEIAIVSRHSSHKNVKYKTIDEVEDLRKYDYYVIASETSLHEEQLRKIDEVARGKKILVEKPLFARPGKFRPVNNVVFVGYNLRYHPLVEYVRNISSKVISVSVFTGQYLPNWRPGSDYSKSYSASIEQGGGVLLDLSHEIDYIQNLFGNLLVTGAVGGKISDLRIVTEDYASFVGVVGGRTKISITVEYLSRIPIRAMHVNTVDGTYIADFIQGTMKIKTEGMQEMEELQMGCKRNYTYSRMHRDIIEGEGSVACSYEQGCSVLEVVSRIKNLMGWSEHGK